MAYQMILLKFLRRNTNEIMVVLLYSVGSVLSKFDEKCHEFILKTSDF